jgi:hypothetical protein
MLATLLIFAQETAEHETSKTPFYVLGLVAAAWAIVLFAIGMRSPSFASTPGTQRGVIAVSVVVTLAAMASSVFTA